MISLKILGSGAATPTLNRGVTAQYLNFNERRILIDCGEGTQMQLRKFKVNFQRIQYIFISHLHGDHYLGLPGLLASMHLLGRVNKLYIFAPPELELIIKQQFELTYVNLSYELEFHSLISKEKNLLFEDDNMKIFSFPLKHRIPCFGFLFEEKEKEKKIIKSSIAEFDLTIEEIRELKKGNDLRREGVVAPNSDFTIEPEEPKSYAYCTDTKYLKNLSDYFSNVDLLYHESTFLESEKDRAKVTFHTTALQAANVANEVLAKKLILGHFSARYKSKTLFEIEAKPVFENTVAVNDGDDFLL